MTNGDDVQRELQALLSAVDPSSAFAPGVRARVAASGAERSRGAAWTWALGAACLAALAWALMARGPAVASVHPASAKVSVVGAQPQVLRTQTQPPERVDRSDRSRHAGLASSRPAPADVGDGNAFTSDSRVLVPDDQRIALVNLLQRLHQGRATVPVSVVPAYDKDGLLVPPEPIVIAPLADPALLDPDDKSMTADPGGSAKDKR